MCHAAVYLGIIKQREREKKKIKDRNSDAIQRIYERNVLTYHVKLWLALVFSL